MTHFTFQELLNPSRHRISELARQYENEEDSGINIEIAKQILHEEDKFDKQRFREKIKEKHKEEKRKLKASKKIADKNDQDETEDNINNNTSDDEYSGPDLSWLPDPDKIYGKQEENYPETQESEEESNIHRFAFSRILNIIVQKYLQKYICFIFNIIFIFGNHIFYHLQTI